MKSRPDTRAQTHAHTHDYRADATAGEQYGAQRNACGTTCHLTRAHKHEQYVAQPVSVEEWDAVAKVITISSYVRVCCVNVFVYVFTLDVIQPISIGEYDQAAKAVRATCV